MGVPLSVSWGNKVMMDWQRLHAETYRWDVVMALRRGHGTALTQDCRTWLGEVLAEAALVRHDARTRDEKTHVQIMVTYLAPPQSEYCRQWRIAGTSARTPGDRGAHTTGIRRAHLSHAARATCPPISGAASYPPPTT